MIDQFIQSPIIPVLTLNNEKVALKIAEIFIKKGFHNLEITLRTDKALDCIKAITSKFPEANVGAGTIIKIEQFEEIKKVGAKFAISPGFTKDLALGAKKNNIFYLPGASTPSEIMDLQRLGFKYLKFFHAKNLGGISMLKAYLALFPKIQFCPTGGITENDFEEYLKLDNVFCLGGSWLTGKNLDYNQINKNIDSVLNKMKNPL